MKFRINVLPFNSVIIEKRKGFFKKYFVPVFIAKDFDTALVKLTTFTGHHNTKIVHGGKA